MIAIKNLKLSYRIFGCALACLLATNSLPADDMVLVVGAGGEEIYSEQFQQWAENWQKLATDSKIELHRVGPGADASTSAAEDQSLNDKQRLRNVITELATTNTEPLWIVMIGHGTFQQGLANFNLDGPDISADEFEQILKPIERPLILLHTFSASGPWLPKLSGKSRMVVTATRGGDEQNFSRFGKFLSAAITDSASDLDHDKNISILEAFLKASSDTTQFYETEGRLQTEHPLIDDNGDALGTPPTFFRGVRVAQKAADDNTPDGQRALTMLVRRSELNQQLSDEQKLQILKLDAKISELRQLKSSLAEDEYFAQLEPLVLELARVELGEAVNPQESTETGEAIEAPANPETDDKSQSESSDDNSP